jgi:hypothetical protein
MKKIFLLGVLFTTVLFTYAGEPVPGAEVYIEQDNNNPPIAFQQTGKTGKVTFSHLPRGKYYIWVMLPEQSGKYNPITKRIDCELRAGYHHENKEYFLHEKEGFFVISFSKLKKLENNNITPGYDMESEYGKKRIGIGKFDVNGNRGSITATIEREKPKQFQKIVNKVKHDTAMSAIRNMK